MTQRQITYVSTIVLAPTPSVSEIPLPAFELRGLGRRAVLPAVLGAAAVVALAVGGGRVHAFLDGLHRGLGVSPRWAGLGVAFECASLAGYVGLLSLVAGRATSRIGTREGAQITLAGAAATRLLPTAGVGGLGLTLWALCRAGLQRRSATRTLLVFLVVLYSVFLAAIALAGTLLSAGLVHSSGPIALPAAAAAAALLALGLGLALAFASPAAGVLAPRGRQRRGLGRVRAGAQLMAEAIREACALVRRGDVRLAGAVAYWAFDAAVLWATLHAFGAAPALAVVALAYFVGQVANTLPVPGSVSGGIAGVLVMFGVPLTEAVPAVLAYRAISVWLPAPVALAAVPALRRTVARWGRADAQAQA